MNYGLTEEQKELQAVARKFAQEQVLPIAKKAEVTGEFPMELFKMAAELGFTTLTIPEKFGGAGLDYFTEVVVFEEIAKADAGFATTIGACGLAATPAEIAGNDEQRQQVADVLLSGGLTAFCLTESGAGSDAAATKTTAVRDGDEYVINGTKTFITNGGVASLYTVFAVTDKSKGVKGISAFLVEADRKGVSVGKEENKMGIRTSNTTDVYFDDVRIPAKNLLGREGMGFIIAMQTLDRTRAAGMIAPVGICQAAIDYCVAYAKQRVTFGKPIIANQAIQFMLADMEIATTAARTLVYEAARARDRGIVDSEFSAVVKTFCGDTVMKVTTDAVQIFGGYGYSREYPVEKLMRDAKIFQIFEGTNQIQRMVIAGAICK